MFTCPRCPTVVLTQQSDVQLHGVPGRVEWHPEGRMSDIRATNLRGHTAYRARCASCMILDKTTTHTARLENDQAKTVADPEGIIRYYYCI